MNECKHEKINRIPNVGFDIDESSEVKEHLEECENCGARRMVSEIIPFDSSKKQYNHYGEWKTDGFLFSTYL